MKLDKAKPFLTARVRLQAPEASLLGLCVGYEGGKWRAVGLAKYLFRNLLQFALPVEESINVNSASATEMLARAAKTVYDTPDYEGRGEVGELLLFAIMREYYDTVPIISKMYFKSAVNDTVKGFDAVHIVLNAGNPELWLGEAKFYSSASAAIRDVVRELAVHLEADYLRQEFMWIEHKTSKDHPYFDHVRRILDENTSLDEIFKIIHIPVLVTYYSRCIRSNKEITDQYVQELVAEFQRHFDAFRAKELPNKIVIHLILVPLEGKSVLLKAFDDRLKALQAL